MYIILYIYNALFFKAESFGERDARVLRPRDTATLRTLFRSHAPSYFTLFYTYLLTYFFLSLLRTILLQAPSYLFLFLSLGLMRHLLLGTIPTYFFHSHSYLFICSYSLSLPHTILSFSLSRFILPFFRSPIYLSFHILFFTITAIAFFSTIFFNNHVLYNYFNFITYFNCEQKKMEKLNNLKLFIIIFYIIYFSMYTFYFDLNFINFKNIF